MKKYSITNNKNGNLVENNSNNIEKYYDLPLE